ncbi:hypothetical protein Bhyg_05993 [Pseudolycoriella hygida]|uniref:Pacifastin domain-containing protein n=1 Tax=Pseudolycoriella hygida TaxID=35572 RepID=A0A9Q0MZY6_9DIPT|nr:hypothetical protein Bhyg_05993 [Pseudolycoriella hygida]
MRTVNAIMLTIIALALFSYCDGARKKRSADAYVPVHSIESANILRSKRSESEVDTNLDSNGRCLEARKWMQDCNSCYCEAGSAAVCTLMLCGENMP